MRERLRFAILLGGAMTFCLVSGAGRVPAVRWSALFAALLFIYLLIRQLEGLFDRALAVAPAEIELPPCTCGIGDGPTTSATASCPRHGRCRGCGQPVGEKHEPSCTVYERVTSTNQPPAVDYGDVIEKPREAAEAARVARREKGRP